MTYDVFFLSLLHIHKRERDGLAFGSVEEEAAIQWPERRCIHPITRYYTQREERRDDAPGAIIRRKVTLTMGYHGEARSLSGAYILSSQKLV